jgi:hypothetical protein
MKKEFLTGLTALVPARGLVSGGFRLHEARNKVENGFLGTASVYVTRIKKNGRANAHNIANLKNSGYRGRNLASFDVTYQILGETGIQGQVGLRKLQFLTFKTQAPGKALELGINSGIFIRKIFIIRSINHRLKFTECALDKINYTLNNMKYNMNWIFECTKPIQAAALMGRKFVFRIAQAV